MAVEVGVCVAVPEGVAELGVASVGVSVTVKRAVGFAVGVEVLVGVWELV